MKIIHKYIIKETIGPLFLGFFIFTLIFLVDKMREMADMIVNKGVDLINILKLLMYILPAYIAITVPMGMLLAVLIAFGRFNSDNEITAMKTNGVHIKTIIYPIVMFSLILSVLMVMFNNYILPKSNYAFKTLQFKILEQRASIAIQERVFIKEFDGFVFFIDKKDEKTNTLINVTTYVLEKEDEPSYIILAKSGKLLSNPNERRVMLKLKDGTIHQMFEKDHAIYNRINFKTYDLDLDIKRDSNIATIQNLKSAREMTFDELGQEITRYFKNGINTNYLLIEYHKKISIPFACLAFTFIGISFGIALRARGKAIGFMISLGIILVYYLLLVFGEVLGQSNTLTPWVAMWFPNIIIGAIGLILLYFTIKEKFSI